MTVSHDLGRADRPCTRMPRRTPTGHSHTAMPSTSQAAPRKRGGETLGEDLFVPDAIESLGLRLVVGLLIRSQRRP
jgi:hypothetical protein